MVYAWYEASCVLFDYYSQQKPCHIGCIHMVSYQCVVSYVFYHYFSLIWLLPGVWRHMSYKITIWKLSFVTMVALIYFISSVYSHMYFKFIFHWVSYITMASLVWFISCMPHMCHKMTIMGEIHATLAALIWTFPGKHHQKTFFKRTALLWFMPIIW